VSKVTINRSGRVCHLSTPLLLQMRYPMVWKRYLTQTSGKSQGSLLCSNTHDPHVVSPRFFYDFPVSPSKCQGITLNNFTLNLKQRPHIQSCNFLILHDESVLFLENVMQASLNNRTALEIHSRTHN
jgi:hypothetical protein